MFTARLFRTIALCAVGVCDIGLLALSASFPFTLGMVVSHLTLIIMFPIVILGFFRKAVFTTWTAVELVWVGVLWILWLSSGAASASIAATVCNICDTDLWRNGVCLSNISNASLCSGVSATSAFSFIGFFILITLWLWTLTVGVSAHKMGDRQIWLRPAYQGVPKTKNDIALEETGCHPLPVEAKYDTSAPPIYSSKPE